MKSFIYGFGLVLSAIASAAPIQVECQGSGAAADRFVYQANFRSNVDDGRGSFSLNADGRGPGGQYDIDNRFSSVPFVFRVKRDNRGRPLETKIRGEVLPDRRSIEIALDLSRPKSEAELEFTRRDGSSVFAQISCTTTLPQVCRTEHKCWRHCHPMIGCEPICQDRTVCERGKFASED